MPFQVLHHVLVLASLDFRVLGSQANSVGLVPRLVAVAWMAVTFLRPVGRRASHGWRVVRVLEAIVELGRHVEDIAHFLAPHVALLDAVRQAQDILAIHGIHAPSGVAKQLEAAAILLGQRLRAHGGDGALPKLNAPVRGGLPGVLAVLQRRQARNSWPGARRVRARPAVLARGPRDDVRHGGPPLRRRHLHELGRGAALACAD
mmetsp:Transcript_101077/g.324677  ORF Transcript_101077/g.324677 Transcript_101077/m.324677 type:complete len:204 (+) Transcript_101077:2499-3110(+)